MIFVCYHPLSVGQAEVVVVKWAGIVLGIALVVMTALVTSRSTQARAQEPTFVSPTEGAAGSRFQLVGEAGWTAGEILTLEFTFLDAPPSDAESFAGPFYHQEQVTVLRDGTWSFPVVINSDLFPFPLWRPGYIAVRVLGAGQATLTLFTYTVDGRGPQGAPPLAELGFGPGGDSHAGVWALVMLLSAGGLVVGASGVFRERAVHAYERGQV